MCHSSGNHAQAMAYASSIAEVRCIVVIPNTAPHIKQAAIEGYGAHLEFCEPTMHDRWGPRVSKHSIVIFPQ